MGGVLFFFPIGYRFCNFFEGGLLVDLFLSGALEE